MMIMMMMINIPLCFHSSTYYEMSFTDLGINVIEIQTLPLKQIDKQEVFTHIYTLLR